MVTVSVRFRTQKFLGTVLGTKSHFRHEKIPKVTSNYTKGLLQNYKIVTRFHKKKRNFEIADVLITAWSRVPICRNVYQERRCRVASGLEEARPPAVPHLQECLPRKMLLRGPTGLERIYFTTFRSVSNSLPTSMGFARWASMPTERAFWRSSSKALAVMATMGMIRRSSGRLRMFFAA